MNRIAWLPESIDLFGAETLTRPRNGRFLQLDPDKLRGGYYTPTPVADWMCSWAIRGAKDRVLEPSCGSGIFLTSAVTRLRALGCQHSLAGQVHGVEIVPSEGAIARDRLAVLMGPDAEQAIAVRDFFDWWAERKLHGFDCIIGNPPFIRYQSFPEPSRSRAMAIMHRLGLRANRLTNIWVPFVAAAAASLNPGGRLAFVLPAELLQVTYAAGLRSFLTDRFSSIDIVTCNELFFRGAEQEVVLLLADGAVPTPSPDNVCRVALHQAGSVNDILNRLPADLTRNLEHKDVRHDQEKWLKYFLDRREIDLMRELRNASMIATLSAHASIDVGIVTGNNDFFVVTADQANSHGLMEHTIPLISRSSQLRGARLTAHEWRSLSSAGERVHLLNFNPIATRTLHGAVAKYVRNGEKQGVHKGYKCSIRSPWFTVPAVWRPEAFFFRQIYDFPRVVRNHAGATSTDTIHRLSCHKPGANALISSLYTHMTAASAEIEGRSYGGGVLELEPTEAERLLTPAELGGGVPVEECDRLVRAGRLSEILQENDRLILRNQLGLPACDCALLKDVWDKMRDRRRNRVRRKRAAVNGTS